MRLNQVTVAVQDIDASVGFYTKLGLKLIVKSPHYARFICPEGDSTFSVHLGDVCSNQSTVVYFENDDLDTVVKRLKEAGLTFETDPTDEPWLWREARLRDPGGNPICLFRAGSQRLNPAWRLPESRP
jgi:catechol 2,3-dioxygenase-like lactoylglutathione lyase family enzyme